MLIILYGDFSNKKSSKQQKMIEKKSTCGYREYARNYGHIIYLSEQNVRLPWEHSITNTKKVIKFISRYPNAIVWSVKYSPKKDREILSKIKNKKIYYSCNSEHRYNKYCDISLVDTKERVKGNAVVWFKGKDPNYWKPNNKEKEFDYLLIGKRADKNELFFLNQLNKIKEKRKILWIGGKRHENRIKTNHEVVCSDFLGQDETRDNIPRAKVGILFTELKIEGFPQSFLEMTICGVPVIYNKKAPRNNFYFHKNNCLLCSKRNIIEGAETLLRRRDSEKCRQEAIDNYSLDKSYDWIKKCIK